MHLRRLLLAPLLALACGVPAALAADSGWVKYGSSGHPYYWDAGTC